VPKLTSPRNNGIEYFQLLDMVSATTITAFVMKLINECRLSVRQRLLWIRHDVDHDLEKARIMAAAEEEHDRIATYLFLHTADYWQSSDFPGAIKDISRMGHNIGLHNNAMVASCKNGGKDPLEIIEDAKKRLEDITGYAIYCTSAHGDKYCHAHGFLNYDIWDRKTLNAFKLFEAYFVRRDAYLTDSGAKWRGQLRDKIPPFEQFEDWMSPGDTISKFNGMEAGIMQLLVHPFWWEVKR